MAPPIAVAQIDFHALNAEIFQSFLSEYTHHSRIVIRIQNTRYLTPEQIVDAIGKEALIQVLRANGFNEKCSFTGGGKKLHAMHLEKNTDANTASKVQRHSPVSSDAESGCLLDVSGEGSYEVVEGKQVESVSASDQSRGRWGWLGF